MDPVHGELSRAMRNRGVELFIPEEHEDVFWDTLDMKTLLHTAGVTGKCVCNLLIEIHKGVKSAIWGEFGMWDCGRRRKVRWSPQTLVLPPLRFSGLIHDFAAPRRCPAV